MYPAVEPCGFGGLGGGRQFEKPVGFNHFGSDHLPEETHICRFEVMPADRYGLSGDD